MPWNSSTGAFEYFRFVEKALSALCMRGACLSESVLGGWMSWREERRGVEAGGREKDQLGCCFNTKWPATRSGAVCKRRALARQPPSLLSTPSTVFYHKSAVLC